MLFYQKEKRKKKKKEKRIPIRIVYSIIKYDRKRITDRSRAKESLS